MNAKSLVDWDDLVRWAEYGESEQNGRDEGVIKDLAARAEAEIRADERRLMLFELAQMARELESVRKFTAATIVKEMWNRVVRRRLKH